MEKSIFFSIGKCSTVFPGRQNVFFFLITFEENLHCLIFLMPL